MTAAEVADLGLAVCVALDALFIVGFVARSRWRGLVGAFLLSLSGALLALMTLRLSQRRGLVVIPEPVWAVGYWVLAGVFGLLLYLLWTTHGRPRPRLRLGGGIMSLRFFRLALERMLRMFAGALLGLIGGDMFNVVTFGCRSRRGTAPRRPPRRWSGRCRSVAVTPVSSWPPRPNARPTSGLDREKYDAWRRRVGDRAETRTGHEDDDA